MSRKLKRLSELAFSYSRLVIGGLIMMIFIVWAHWVALTILPHNFIGLLVMVGIMYPSFVGVMIMIAPGGKGEHPAGKWVGASPQHSLKVAMIGSYLAKTNYDPVILFLSRNNIERYRVDVTNNVMTIWFVHSADRAQFLLGFHHPDMEICSV